MTGRVGMTGTAFFAAYADVVVGSFAVTFDHLAGEGAGAVSQQDLTEVVQEHPNLTCIRFVNLSSVLIKAFALGSEENGYVAV